MIRNMLMEMPGKLDHASVVAFKVGHWETRERTPRPLVSNNSSDTLKQNGNRKFSAKMLSFKRAKTIKLLVFHSDFADSPSRPSEAPPPVPTSLPPPLILTKQPIVELNCLVRITKPTQNININAVSAQNCLFSLVF